MPKNKKAKLFVWFGKFKFLYHKTPLIFLSIAVLETLSFIGFKFDIINSLVFSLLVLATLGLSLYKLEYGIFIIIAELIIGSKGYLFSLQLFDVSLSIRIALWLIIMSVWSTKIFLKLIKGSTRPLANIIKTKTFQFHVPLFIFIIWGLVNGILQKNSFNNIFDDFNAWLFFLLLFPMTSVFLNYKYDNKVRDLINKLSYLATASLLWVCAKTFFLLYIFSHNIFKITPSVYKWVRDTGVGEITQMQGGFYRIFFQSHIFVLLAFVSLVLLLSGKFSGQTLNLKIFKTDKTFFFIYAFLVFLLSTTLINLSRSNWVGLIIGLSIIQVLIFVKYKIKKIALINVHLIMIFIFSFLLIAAIVKFPFPNPASGFNAAELIAKRAGQVSGEAGVSSRWALLPELFSGIKEHPLLGSGFGSTVTYKTSDPTVLKSSATGNYTTYAFEWGWLDIWLKLGVFGLSAYLYLLFGIFFKTTDNSLKTPGLKTAVVLSLASLATVNFFSPYLNHPLGIGFLLICGLIMEFSSGEAGELQKN
jgi:hypothetical protein